MTTALISANRAAAERLAVLQGTGPQGILAGTSLETRSFHPGNRTADTGLGSGSGMTTIHADDGANRRWTLHDTSRLEDADGGEVAETRGTHVTVTAGEGGTYLLRAHDASGPAGEILLSVPYIVYVVHSAASVGPELAAAGIDAADREHWWGEVMRTARTVAEHVLRPVNARLSWVADSENIPPLDAQPEGSSMLARRTATGQPVRRIVITIALDDSLLTDVERWIRAVIRQMTESEEDAQWNMSIARLFGHADAPISAHVTARLGGTGDTEVDDILRTLAASPDREGKERWAEMAGRLLGVTIGRAALRGIGLRPVAQRPAGVKPCDVLEPQPRDETASLLGLHRPAGATISTLAGDLAALPAGASADERRTAMTHRWGDLVELFAREWGTAAGSSTRYDVLSGLVSSELLETARLIAPLPAPYGRRALAPGSRDAELDTTDDVITPARYGSELDDPDDRRTAIADLQTDLRRVGIDYGLHHAGLYGYRRIGFSGASVDRSVFDGELADTPPTYSVAQSRQVQRGYTGLAVREFRIASRYPNDVVETPTPVAPYGNRLAVAATHEERADDGEAGEPLDDVDGEVSPATALEIRAWVFARRRVPVVVEARQLRAGRSDWTVNDTELFASPHAHNLLGPNDIDSRDPRMFVLDLSGMPQRLNPDAPEERLVLGDYNGQVGDPPRDTYGGPRSRAPHRLAPITLDATFGAASPVHVAPAPGAPDPGEDWLAPGTASTAAQVREWFTSAFRVIYAVTQKETGGFWDGFNGWDLAVWSYPLFHYTLRLRGGRPGKMAEVVRWLQVPDDDIPADPHRRDDVHDAMKQAFQRSFGRYGVGAGPIGRNDPTGYVHIAGLRSATGETRGTPWQVDMAADDWHGQNASGQARMRAFYDSYVQWFRSWPWAARFVRSLRYDGGLQRLLIAHAIDWSAHALERNVRGGVAHSLITSEVAAAAYLRAYVKEPAQSDNGFNAVERASWAANQRTAAEQFVAGITDEGLRDSAGDAIRSPGLSVTDLPTPTQLREARDWVLRSEADEN